MILRFFRAIVHEGKQAEFQEFFVKKMLPRVHAQPGALSVNVGLPRPDTPTEFSMVMIWRDLEALKGFAGYNWNQAVIDPEEEDLLKETYLYHYELAEQ